MAHEDLLDRIKRLDVQTIRNMSHEVIARLTHNFDEILVKNMLYTATTNYQQRKLIKIIKKAYKSWKKDTDMLWGSMPQLESYPEYMEELQTDIECGLVITEKGVFEENRVRLTISLVPSNAVPLKAFQKGSQSALSKDEVNSHQIPATASPVQNSEQQSVIELQDARIKELEADLEELRKWKHLSREQVALFCHALAEYCEFVQKTKQDDIAPMAHELFGIGKKSAYNLMVSGYSKEDREHVAQIFESIWPPFADFILNTFDKKEQPLKQ